MRRECPIALALDDSTLVEGVLDLCLRERGRWCVVDFKTDVSPEGRRAGYEAQVELYVLAVAAATGEPAEGVLLVV